MQTEQCRRSELGPQSVSQSRLDILFFGLNFFDPGEKRNPVRGRNNSGVNTCQILRQMALSLFYSSASNDGASALWLKDLAARQGQIRG